MPFSSRCDHAFEGKSLILDPVFITILLLNRESWSLLAHRLARFVYLTDVGFLDLRVEHQMGRWVYFLDFMFQLRLTSRLAMRVLASTSGLWSMLTKRRCWGNMLLRLSISWAWCYFSLALILRVHTWITPTVWLSKWRSWLHNFILLRQSLHLNSLYVLARYCILLLPRFLFSLFRLELGRDN